jgi:cell division protein FtsL
VDLVALGLLAVLILGVYLAKTIAGGERAKIASVERQIVAEKARIRLLQAEVSHLEQPARIERLSETYLGMAPVAFRREADADALPELAHKPLALPAKAVEATPDPIAIAPREPAAPLATSTQVATR